MSIRCKRNAASVSNDFFDKISQFKYYYSIAELKSANLNFYYDKNYKEFKDWIYNAVSTFKINLFYFFNEWEKLY